MSISSNRTEILAFVAQHNPSKSRAYALVRDSAQPAGAVALEAVATVSEPARADELCAALNQYVYDQEEALGFQTRLRAVLADEPASVSASIDQTLARIRMSPAFGNSVVKGVSRFGSLPLSACPSTGCPACGQCVSSCKDCLACNKDNDYDFDVDCECEVQMPPRTASLIHAIAEIYSDFIHDSADEIPDAIPLRPHSGLWPVPPIAHKQTKDFYRKFARAFEDIAHDIDAREHPQPHNMAEEIALHIVLDRAAEIVEEDSEDLELWTTGLPGSVFDFDFDLLQDCLFQDKDYEIYLTDGKAASPGDLQEWFEDFNYPESREPSRGFRR